MMQALARLGHGLGLMTAVEPDPRAVAGLPLALARIFPKPGEATPGPEPTLSGLQERFRNYWGIDPNRLRAVAQAAADLGADAVVVVGLNVLPYLGAVHGRQRVWYAADEWFWHHVSQTRVFSPSTWGELRQAVVKGIYERAYKSVLDRVWVVTEGDRRAMHWVAGVHGVDVIPNGVDGDHYRPIECQQEANSCTFWGRLDFGPNVQALEWFCKWVWPLLQQRVPEAQFTVYGFNPTPAIRELTARDGVRLIPDLPDLRTEVARHQVVVLPFVSGGGIKNKLLEAAAMGKAIVSSPTACGGLRLPGDKPFLLGHGPQQWVEHLTGLWQDAAARQKLGEAARHWVLEHHSWRAAALQAEQGLSRSQKGAVP
jgi:glycosyltransferase involved in cell wall biosynthesis